MIDLGTDLDGYSDENKPKPPWPPPADAPPLFTGMGMPRSIGKLTDMQAQGFNTIEPPMWRALRNIKQIRNTMDTLLDNKIDDQ
jgi:hypothetical protein